MNKAEYERRLNNTKIFADALLKNKVVILHEVNNKKNIAVYVPKNKIVIESRPTGENYLYKEFINEK